MEGRIYLKRRALFSVATILPGFLYIAVRLMWAYIEPGYSTFLLKILISGLAGAAVILRPILKAIKYIFRQLFSGSDKQKGKEQ